MVIASRKKFSVFSSSLSYTSAVEIKKKYSSLFAQQNIQDVDAVDYKTVFWEYQNYKTF